MSGLLRSCSGSRLAAPRARPQASEAPTRPKEKRGGATSTRTCPWRGKLHCTTTTPQSFRQMLTVRWSWLSRRVTSSQFMETWMMTAFTWGSLEGNVDLCPGKMDYCHNHPHHRYLCQFFYLYFHPYHSSIFPPRISPKFSFRSNFLTDLPPGFDPKATGFRVGPQQPRILGQQRVPPAGGRWWW